MSTVTRTPEPLIFPRGVRFPRENEVPADMREQLVRIEDANITTGYTLTVSDGTPFSSYLEANIHANNIFSVFRELAWALLPDVAAPIIGFKDEEPDFGPYTDRAWAVGVFEPHIDALQNDGFLEFGIVHQSETAFEEIFVASSKYFKIWTNNGARAEEVLNKAGIPQCDTLQFIDEFPMVSTSLDNDGNAAWANPFNSIKGEFLRLPKPSIDEIVQ